MDKTIQMAREAGIYHAFDSEGHWDGLTNEKLIERNPHPDDIVYGEKRTVEILKRFEALVRADEREACAEVCEDMNSELSPEISAAIRARGQA